MLKRAVDSHQALNPAPKPLSQTLFPSSSPPVPQETIKQALQRPTARPLSTTNSNVIRPNTARPPSGANTENRHPTALSNGVKRTSSGLEKTLGKRDAFEGPLYPHLNSQNNPIIVGDNSPVKMAAAASLNDVYIDENDFDSDIDLDIENPATKGSVSYPELHLPSARPIQPIFQQTSPKAAAHATATREQESDSGYVSRAHTSFERTPQPPPQPPTSSMDIPWSSSPAEHFKLPAQRPDLRSFAHNESVPAQHTIAGNKPRPTKRRTLPWLEEQAMQQEEVQAEEHVENQKRKRSGKDTTSAHFTPLPKDTGRSQYAWNATMSAVKEQQKALRQANKKIVTTSDAADEAKPPGVLPKKRRSIARVFLSEEQRHVRSLVVDHSKSVFFTGSAGTGKSVLLREIISGLREKYKRESDRVAVTASTGLAACNIGGVTLHSFAGIGLGKEPVEELVKKIKRNQKAKHRWMRTKVLIIDEISMVDGELFDKLERIARLIKNNGRPFGGIQLVITGDFFQLPPVPEGGRVAKFAFEASTWNTSIEHTIGLHHVFRQKDPEFAAMLNEMREGRLSEKSIRAFKSMSREMKWDDDLQATELFPTRTEVDKANNARMCSLVGEVQVFQARDGGTITDKAFRDKLLQNCMATEELALKKGAQVMLIKNIDQDLVNGSLGKVLGFMDEATFGRYTQDEDAFRLVQETPDEELNPAEAKLKRTINTGLAASTARQWPLVEFVIADGTLRQLLCQPEVWKVELPNGEVQASRTQVPLILAWALSIHKAQGQTLERVKVDLGKVFEKGQAYVALSRATSMAGLQVLRFDPRKVIAHERVRGFYASLSRAEMAGGGKGEGKGKKKGRSAAEDYEQSYLEDAEWAEQEAAVAYG